MDNKYKRPEKTFQDTLGKDEIAKLLKDYSEVDNIYDVPINSHLRYFVKKNGKENFRMGGYLTKIEPKKGYIVLSNGKVTWSVQVNNSKFFRKMEISEVREYYDKKIKKYKKKIHKLEGALKEITKKLKSKK